MNTRKYKNKFPNAVNEYHIKLLGILVRLCIDLFLQRIGSNFSNKYNAVTQKVVYDKE